MAKIKSRLFQIRKQHESKEGRRVSLVEVAEKTGINRKTLARLEQVENFERVETDILAKLCAFYGVGVGDLLEYDPNGIRSPSLVAHLTTQQG